MNKSNADKDLEDLIEKLKKENVKPKLLLHSCCAPCSSYVLEYLNRYFDITVFYFNPNIYPKEEYEKRKNEEIRFIKEFKSDNKINYIEGDYGTAIYDEKIIGLENEKEGGARCKICFDLRLNETAKRCKELNFDYFMTTLTVSPYKNAEAVNESGYTAGKLYGVNYLASDFKKKNGYIRSIQLSKEYNLYRQHYCGCRFSKSNYEEYIKTKEGKI